MSHEFIYQQCREKRYLREGFAPLALRIVESDHVCFARRFVAGHDAVLEALVAAAIYLPVILFILYLVDPTADRIVALDELVRGGSIGR
jgi:hypothetical protein